MSIRAIIIEANRDYRALLAHHLSSHWTDARITEYDPVESGQLDDAFSGAGNDLVLLGSPGQDASSLEWLGRFAAVREFPPVVSRGFGVVK